MSKTLVIVDVKCIKPSSGIDDTTRGISAIVGAIAGGVAAGAGTVATGGALAATVGLGIVGGAGLGVALVDGIDHFFSGADDLYITVDDKKVWPGGSSKYEKIDTLETRTVDYFTSFNRKLTI